MHIPTRTIFGAGELNNLRKQELPGKKALVVISNGKSGKAILPRLEEQLKLAGLDRAIYDGIAANPVKSMVAEGSAIARKNVCDFVIALGGGSVMDAAKAIALMATNEGDLWDYVRADGKKAPNRALPIVAITTTAGTGSEGDAWGVITNPETPEKVGIGGTEDLFPRLAIVDAELTLTVPPDFTAYQGFDALFHSVECYISAFANPLSDMFAIAAIEIIARNLPECVKNGANLAAREALAYANTLSGWAMSVGRTTSQHSLEHALSAYHPKLPHGAGLIMLSGAFFAHFVRAGKCDDRFLKMARAMGVHHSKNPADFLAALAKLRSECGVDNLKMSDYGVVPAEFETLAKNARATMGSLFLSDRSPLTDEDSARIYQESYR